MSGSPDRILFVCLGNLCRSPLAERLLIHRLDAIAPGWASRVGVGSAGLLARDGMAMDPLAAAELVSRGGSSDGFAARRATDELLLGSALVLTATMEIRERVLADQPRLVRRAFTLTEFADLVGRLSEPVLDVPGLVAQCARRRAAAEPASYDLGDPIGQSAQVHAQTAAAIDAAVTGIAQALASALAAGADSDLAADADSVLGA